MFPATHLYLLEHLYNLSDELTLGSVFPDTVISNSLTWNDTHRRGREFIKFLSPRQRRELKSFLQGYLSHGVDPKGLDYYGDENYENSGKGYSFIKSAPLVERVMACCKIDRSMGLWKAHNFIEMGIEVLVSKDTPRLGDCIKSALVNDELINKISKILEAFFKVDSEEIGRSFKRFNDFIGLEPGNIDNLAEKYVFQLNHKHNLEGVEKKDISMLIEAAIAEISGDYKKFLEECVLKVGKEVTE
ncbi:MAG: hypothetical protein M1536_00095, partial [Firmicutes bacterium]|nr:hypothetical protein [Bacillota bacterium]